MQRSRRLAALLIGAWLAGSAFMDATAINSFRAVDRFLQGRGTSDAQLIREVGPERARLLLRRIAGEANTTLFGRWGWVQIGLGMALIVVFSFESTLPKLPVVLSLLMLTIVLLSQFWLQPNIALLGRVIEFLPAGTVGPQREAFGRFHGISSSLELVKLAFGSAMAGVVLKRNG